MSAANDKDSVRAKRYTRLAFFSAYVLAFLWPLGSFFFWICLGTTAYLAFLAFYFSPGSKKFNTPYYKRSKPKTEPSEVFAYGQSANPLDANQKKKVQVAILAISGLVIFIAIVMAQVRPGESETPTNEDTGVTGDWVVLQSNPNDINALTNIGNQFYSTEQYDSAMFYYERVLTIDPDNVACMHNKALVLYQKKEYSQSLVWAKKCLFTDPEYIDAILLIGDGYYIQQNYNEAIGWYQQAYAKGAHHTELLNVMAYIYDKQNNQSQAIRLYKESLKQDSSYVEAYERLAVLEPERNDWYRKKIVQWKQK
jgi:tetratricopeptide (TPR) repeat protein